MMHDTHLLDALDVAFESIKPLIKTDEAMQLFTVVATTSISDLISSSNGVGRFNERIERLVIRVKNAPATSDAAPSAMPLMESIFNTFVIELTMIIDLSSVIETTKMRLRNTPISDSDVIDELTDTDILTFLFIYRCRKSFMETISQ